MLDKYNSNANAYAVFFPVAAALSALALYAITVAPTISWGDSADLAMRLVYDGDHSFVGRHRDYTLWRLFGQTAILLPFDDAGLRANLFTAFWGAVTVGAVVWFVTTVSRSAFAAIAAGTALAVSHTFWLLSVIAEVYTFNTAFVMLAFACVAQWWHSGEHRWLWIASACSGLSLAHHATGLVLLASISPLIVARLRDIPLRHQAVALLLLLIFSVSYWTKTLPILTTDMPYLEALGLQMTQNRNFQISMREILKFGAYLGYNFIGLAFLLVMVGVCRVIYKKIWPMLPPLIWATAFIYAGVTSSIPDKFNVYVMIYPVFALLVGFGVVVLESRTPLRGSAKTILLILITVIPPASYLGAAKLSGPLGIDLVGAREAPMRDNNFYFLWPPKNADYGPRLFAEEALNVMQKNGVLIADYTLWRPLYFVQAVEGLRPDVELVFVERLLRQGVADWIEGQECSKSIYLATDRPAAYYQLEEILDRFFIVESGNIFEVRRAC